MKVAVKEFNPQALKFPDQKDPLLKIQKIKPRKLKNMRFQNLTTITPTDCLSQHKTDSLTISNIILILRTAQE